MVKLQAYHLLPALVLVSFAIVSPVILHLVRFYKTDQGYINPGLFPFELGGSRDELHSRTDLSHSLHSFKTLVLDNYLQWHRRTYSSYQASIRLAEQSGKPFPRPPRMLIVRSDESLSHGLGDRFRAIVSAYFLAVLSNRLLLIDWQHPIPLVTAFTSPPYTNFTYDKRFLLPPPFDDSVIVEGNYYHQTDTRHTEVTTIFIDSVPRPNVTRWFSPPEYRRQQNTILAQLALLQPLRPCIVLPYIFRVLFSPTPALRQAIHKRLQEPRLSHLITSGTTYTAVHARLGLGVGEERKDAGRFNLTRLGTTLRGMARCFVDAALPSPISSTDPSTHRFIFLATDTPEFRPLLEEEVLRQAPHVTTVYMDGNVKHVRNLDGNTEDDIGTFLDTFIELLLLAKAERMVNLRSGFADLATWMGGTCNQEIIDYESCAMKYGML